MYSYVLLLSLSYSLPVVSIFCDVTWVTCCHRFGLHSQVNFGSITLFNRAIFWFCNITSIICVCQFANL